MPASTSTSNPAYPIPTPLASKITGEHTNGLMLLEDALKSITDGHRRCGPSAGPITDCVKHGGPWRAAFKRFYIPGSDQLTLGHRIEDMWMGCRPQGYMAEIRTMFEMEDLMTISKRVERERKAHIRDSQTTTAPWEDKKVAKARSRAEELWLVGKHGGPYLREASEKLKKEVESGDERGKKWNEMFSLAETRDQQRDLLRMFACDPQPGDTAADLALRAKWARHFDSNMHYGEIESAMKNDIAMAQERVAELDTKLADLQSAYMAETRKTELEEEERRRVERENERRCEGCGTELEVVEEGLACERCWEERRDGEGRLRTGWYCGEECAKGDAERHNKQFHGAS